MILIISKANDTHADMVEKHLSAMNEKFIRIDTGWLPDQIQITIEVKNGQPQIFLHQNGTSIDITHPKSVWFRKPTDTQLSPCVPKEVSDLIQRECQHFWTYAWEAIHTTCWINHPRANIRANNRILQWQSAQQVGFDVPDTTISNSPASILTAWHNADSRLAVKVLNQTVIEKDGKMLSMYTKLLDASMVEKLTHVSACPIIVQPYIDKLREWRVTIVENRIFACEIHSQDSCRANIDWRRYDLANVPHIAGRLPKEIEDKCFALTKELGLCFGAIDLIEKPNNEFVFLEINPNGQWAWVEALTGLPISKTIAEHLAQKF